MEHDQLGVVHLGDADGLDIREIVPDKADIPAPGLCFLLAVPINEAMTIYDVLCNAKDGCCPSGEFVSINSLSAIQGGSMARNGGIFQQTAESFQGKTEELRRACRAMGGSEVGGGDVGFRLELFQSLDMVLRYWDGDEEFPASMQILVDRNILDYMHYETVMFALSHVLDCLRGQVHFSD